MPLSIELILDTMVLFLLGFCGWQIFKALRIPTAALMGTIVVIGTLRILQLPLPSAPGFITLLVQVFLGIYVGGKVTRDTVAELKAMVRPVLVIVTWAVAVVFLMGSLLGRISHLEPITAILSSSMGGLPEMTVIALATNADIPVIIVMQSARMLVTVFAFPLIFKRWLGDGAEQGENSKDRKANARGTAVDEKERRLFWNPVVLAAQFSDAAAMMKRKLIVISHEVPSMGLSLGQALITVGIALAGGLLLDRLGVPAGAMVGAMLCTAAASLAGLKILLPSPRAFGFMLVGVGIMVSDNITAETLDTIVSGNLLFPVIVSLVLLFASSLLVAIIIHRLVGWDYPTCFLAASPAGFTVMTTLAIRYNRDPFRVSMLHLCRLLAIKTVVPLAFMFII